MWGSDERRRSEEARENVLNWARVSALILPPALSVGDIRSPSSLDLEFQHMQSLLLLSPIPASGGLGEQGRA